MKQKRTLLISAAGLALVLAAAALLYPRLSQQAAPSAGSDAGVELPEGTVPETDNNASLTIPNQRIPETPKTGDALPVAAVATLGVASGVCLLTLRRRRRKK